jgi:hypothetical protein
MAQHSKINPPGYCCWHAPVTVPPGHPHLLELLLLQSKTWEISVDQIHIIRQGMDSTLTAPGEHSGEPLQGEPGTSAAQT